MTTPPTDTAPRLSDDRPIPPGRLLSATDIWPVVVIAAVYLCKVILVPPSGEFPFADEWDYVGTIRHLLNTGNLTLSDWPTMTLVAHLAWGLPFAWLFGPSYAVLRGSMLVMSCLGALGIYVWARDCGWNRGPALWLALAFALCPPTVCYEYSFMTDMTGITGMIWLAVLLRRWDARSTRAAALIGVFAGTAYLARQSALIPLMAWLPFAALDVIRSRRRAKPLFVMLLIAVAMAVAHALWLRTINGLPYGDRLLSVDPPDFAKLADRVQALILGAALYSAPVLLGLWSLAERRFSWKAVVVFVGLVALTLATFRTIPSTFIRDEFFDTGMGFSNHPEGLRGPTFQIAGHEITAMRAVTTLIAAAAVWAALVLIGQYRRGPAMNDSSDRRATEGVLWPLTMLILTAVLPLAIPMFHGRYIWPVSVASLMLVAAAFPDRRWSTSAPKLGVALTLLYGVISIVGIQDSFTRVRAVWAAAERLQAEGVSPADISGLFEFAGAYRYLPLHRGEKNQGPYFATLSDEERRRLFDFIFGDKPYVIKLHPTPGYRTVSQFRWRSWVRSGNVIVQTRDEPPR
ncbi:hypothetical protein AYO47_07180 [Planctomyces sp. SCGC AG-212-M04]|nr:hypothetical protein AYO47_07180 [Planctomyces sp. SCGC AG-212-M04]